MTKSEFVSECTKRLIDVNVALENERVVNALKERDDLELQKALDEEF